MKNLMTRKIVLGMLMTLVLAFGVPDVTDAVTVDINTNAPDFAAGSRTVDVRSGESFEITFTFKLNSRTRITNTDGRQTDDGHPGLGSTTAGSPSGLRRVDSAGYYVVRIGSTDYRILLTTGVTPSVADYIAGRRSPNSDYSAIRKSDGSEPAAGDRYSNSSRYYYDNLGNQLYYYRLESGTAGDPGYVAPARGGAITVLDQHWSKVTSESDIYYYDEEAISIDPPDADMTYPYTEGLHP